MSVLRIVLDSVSSSTLLPKDISNKVSSFVVNFAAYMWTHGKGSEYMPNPYRFID